MIRVKLKLQANITLCKYNLKVSQLQICKNNFISFNMLFLNAIWTANQKVTALKKPEFPAACKFLELRQITVTREFPRLNLFPAVSQEFLPLVSS